MKPFVLILVVDFFLVFDSLIESYQLEVRWVVDLFFGTSSVYMYVCMYVWGYECV
jgi:hypothetical protein